MPKHCTVKAYAGSESKTLWILSIVTRTISVQGHAPTVLGASPAPLCAAGGVGTRSVFYVGSDGSINL
jgi:hypothetical protein